MAKAVIFDLDGVLIESETYFIEAGIDIFKKHGLKLTKEVIARHFGLRSDDYLRALEKHFKVQLDHQAIAKELRDRIAHMYAHDIPLVANAKETLETLRSEHELALATSREKRLALDVLRRFGILDYFDARVFREDVKRGKPHPEVFMLAAGALGVKPTDCVVVEDARNGFRAGRAAGMFVIARDAEHNRSQDFSEADVVIKDLAEIPSLLSKNTF